MSALIEGNSDYHVITVMKVDWDQYKSDAIVSDLDVRRRSTLIMFNDGKEVDRVIAQTSADAIEAMFVKALS